MGEGRRRHEASRETYAVGTLEAAMERSVKAEISTAQRQRERIAAKNL